MLPLTKHNLVMCFFVEVKSHCVNHSAFFCKSRKGLSIKDVRTQGVRGMFFAGVFWTRDEEISSDIDVQSNFLENYISSARTWE